MAAHSNAKSFGALDRAAPRWIGISFGVLRSASRCVGFALVLVFAAADCLRVLFFRSSSEPMCLRALWLQRWSRVFSRLIGLQLRHHGTPPSSGMIVSNHLGYLDILAYSTLVPCVFVAKQEVASWPVLGLFARMAGTIFVDRTRRIKVADVNRRIAQALQSGTVVVLFPEGTSSDGRTVLPFRSSLLEPVAQSPCTLTPAAIRYHLDEGSVADEVCYWRDMTLLPHLLNLLTKSTVRAKVAFGTREPGTNSLSRKRTALRLHHQVAGLHANLAE